MKLLVRQFATRAAPSDLRRPGPWSGKALLSRNLLGKNRLSVSHGFLGHGEPLKIKYKRRWRGGRYNYFDWNTLVQCIDKCASVIEGDRMPSPQELNYFYRGAQIGVRHHGGFDIVSQILNFRPYRSYLIKAKEYPSWIEEQWIEKKMDENNNTSSPHRHSIPHYLKYENKVKNIRGKMLTNNDKRRIIREIYKKINIANYENDIEKREALKYEYKLYKQQLRNAIVLEQNELGFGIETIESDKQRFNKKYYSSQEEHILFTDSSHIDTEEKQFTSKQQKRGSLKNKLSALINRKKR